MRILSPLLALLALSLAAPGCGDDAKPRDTAEPDGDTGDTSDSNDTGDTGSGVDGDDGGPDGSDGGDTGGDDSLEGTALEGIGFAWEAPLTLCTRWQEGASRLDQMEHKVRLTLPVQTRAGLSRSALEAARVVGAEVETGPLSVERFAPIASSRLLTWELTRGDGFDALQLQVEHDLGAGGTLYESGYVMRSPGDTSPVVMKPDGYEVTFFWAPPGGESGGFALGPCGVPEDYELAVEAFAGTAGDTNAGFLRFYRTYYSDISAGSYPVLLEATQVMTSDDPWRVLEAHGYWAHTYVAQHHNWYEDSVVDFARDLASWQVVFGPQSRGEPVPEGTLASLVFQQVAGDAAGEVDLVRLDAQGRPKATTVILAAPPRRVDANHLRRQYASACASPEVGALGYAAHLVQVVLCPEVGGPGGRRLEALVPVRWLSAPAAVGEPVEKVEAISGGWKVTLGGEVMELRPQQDGAFIIDVKDAGGESVLSAYSELAELAPEQRWDADVHAKAEGVEVRIARRWAAQGVGESAIYAVESMELVWPGGRRLVSAWDLLVYTNTHHNWQDELVATTDDGLTLRWKITYDFENGEGLVQRVSVFDAEGTELLAPTVVTPVEVAR